MLWWKLAALKLRLRTGDWVERLRAVREMGATGSPTALPALLGAVRDEHEAVRDAAVNAIAVFGTAARPILVALLSDPSPGLRATAATALGDLGRAEALPALLEALYDEDDRVHAAAVKAIAQIGEAEAVPHLIQQLQTEHGTRRVRVIEALEKLRDLRSVEPLINALYDEDTLVRRVAARALGRIGDMRAAEPIRATLDRVDDAGEQRLLFDALRTLGPPRPSARA